MRHVNRRSLLLLSFLVLLLVQFGRWQGQINENLPSESGNNSIFLLVFAPVLFITLYANRQWGYLTVFRPLRGPLLLFLAVIIGVGLFRDDLSSAARNMASIVLTYSIILGLSAMSFSLPFRRMFDVYIIFIAYLFLPVTIYVHLTEVGPLVLFPDRLESNNLRLGGLVYYAHAAMLLGVGGMFSLYQFLQSRTYSVRLYYGLTFILLNIFLLFTDCRSTWGGVALTYALLVLLNLPRHKRWAIISLTALTALLFYSGVFEVKTTKQYRTTDDFEFRLAIWGLALQGISENPLTGYGTENYFSSNRKAMDMDERLSDPHSAALSLALQSGLLALILFFRLYYYTVRHYSRHALGAYKPLIAVCLYWLFAPFFWGTVYNGAAGFIQILFPLTYFVSLLHPDLYRLVPMSRVLAKRASAGQHQAYQAEFVEQGTEA